MAENNKLEQAKLVFETICRTLESEDWHYQADEEKLMIGCSARGDDLAMDINIKVDAERSIVMLFSQLPFPIQEDKRLDLAVAIAALNNNLADGCFDYNISNGAIYFRLTNSYIDSTLSQAVFSYMLYCACQTIDDYNDKFLMLAKGMFPLEQFLAMLERK